jgi:hypothetical protein
MCPQLKCRSGGVRCGLDWVSLDGDRCHVEFFNVANIVRANGGNSLGVAGPRNSGLVFIAVGCMLGTSVLA